MKAFRYILLHALLIALGIGMASEASAQRDPRDKKRGDSTIVRTDTIRKKDTGDRGDTVRKKEDTGDRGDTVRKKEDTGDRGDTIRKKGDGHRGDLRDKPGHRGRVHELIEFYAKNDSCRRLLLANMSDEDAAALNRLYAALKGGNEQLQTLRAELRAAREAGDTAAFRRISEQLKNLYRQQGEFHKAIAELFNKYQDRAMRIRKECGGRPPKDRDGDTGDRRGGIIAPNPVNAGGTTVLTLTLEAESMVGVTISDQTGPVLTIPAATLPAGDQQIALDVSGLARGVYLVQVQNGDKMEVLKLMVR